MEMGINVNVKQAISYQQNNMKAVIAAWCKPRSRGFCFCFSSLDRIIPVQALPILILI